MNEGSQTCIFLAPQSLALPKQQEAPRSPADDIIQEGDVSGRFLQ